MVYETLKRLLGLLALGSIVASATTFQSPLDVKLGGTSCTTASCAINGILPSQTSNSGKFLTTNGSVTSWATVSASAAFNALTSGTNTTAAMVVGSGATLSATGSGTIAATSAPFSGVSAGTNTGSLVIGSSGSLTVTGTGTITADKFIGSGSTTNAVDLATAEVAGVLPVANGGTGSGTQNFVDLTTGQSIAGAKVFTSALQASLSLKIKDTGSANTVTVQAPTLASGYTLILPVDDGTTGQALTTDGSGVLSWTTVATGGMNTSMNNTDLVTAIPGGTNLQFAAGGEAFISTIDDATTPYSVNLKAGNASTSGTGGAITLTGGNSAGGGGQGVIAAGGTGTASGGAFSFSGGAASAGSGGGFTVTGGAGTGGAGGNVSLSAGLSDTTAGTVSIFGGAAATNDVAGGAITIQSGAGNGSAAGGALNLFSGNNGATGGYAGGAININTSGAVGGSGGPGGAIVSLAGSGDGAGAGGAISITAGSGGASGAGGVASLIAGPGGASDTVGGNNAVVKSGDASMAGTLPGDVVLNVGVNFSDSNAGSVVIKSFGGAPSPTVKFFETPDSGSSYIGLKASNSLSATTVFTLPTADGVAGKSIITDGSGNLSLSSPVATMYATGDADLAVSADADFVDTNATLTADRTATLPPCSGSQVGKPIDFMKTDSGGFNLIVAGNGGDTINGSSTKTITVQYSGFKALCRATGVWLAL